MLKIMRIVLTIVMCAMLASSVGAQQQASLEDIQKQLGIIGQMVSAQLGITDAQVAQFKALCGGYKGACDTIKNSADADDVKVVKMQALADKFIPEAMSLLSEQQKTGAIALGSALLNMHSSGSGIVLNGSEIKGLIVKAGLAPEKSDIVLDVMRSHSVQAKAIYADESLSADAQNAKLQSLRLATLAKISSKLDANEQKVMAAVLKSGMASGKTLWSCLTAAQKPKAQLFGNQILRFFEEVVTISKA